MSKDLSQKEAAEYIGVAEATLRSGRSRGVLAGVKPPAHIKQGGKIFFKKTTLDRWKKQFKEEES